MDFKIYNSAADIGKKIAEELAQVLANKPNALICIAAGNSSLCLFEELIKLHKQNKISFKDAYFIAMDEWLNMNKDTKGSCGDFLVKNFFSNVNFNPNNIRLVDGKANDLQEECNELKNFINEHSGIDYMVLGVGMNGHLALNEPGVSFEKSVHVCALDEVTKNVGKKYFSNSPQLEGGVTLGISDIKNSKKVVLIVNGKAKQEILKSIINSEITNNIPATVLKDWQHSVIMCDEQAGELL